MPKRREELSQSRRGPAGRSLADTHTRPPQSEGRLSSRSRSRTRWRTFNIIVGGMLVGAVVLWLGWLLLHPNAGAGSFLPLPGFVPTSAPPVVNVSPLSAEGITLSQPAQSAKLNQQQALLIANQLEEDAATKAKSMDAQYVLLTYPNTGTPVAHADLENVPAWLIHYQKIPLQPTDASVDSTPFPHSTHDLYVFLDANTGKELLAVWI